MIPKVKSVKTLTSYRIEVVFADGASGIVDIADTIGFGGILAPLRDPAFFKRVHVGRSYKTVTWPGELDLDPVMLYHRATGKPIDWILDAPEPETKKTPRKTTKKARVYA